MVGDVGDEDHREQPLHDRLAEVLDVDVQIGERPGDRGDDAGVVDAVDRDDRAFDGMLFCFAIQIRSSDGFSATTIAS